MWNFFQKIKNLYKKFTQSKVKGTSSIELLFFTLVSLLLLYCGVEIYKFVRLYATTQQMVLNRSKKQIKNKMERIKKQLTDEDDDEDDDSYKHKKKTNYKKDY